jgi:DNA topoisomerase-1
MKLVLVESPTKARKLTGYLGSGFVVRASLGHIRDLPKSKLGVDVQHGFQPEYLIPKEKSKVVKELKLLAAQADQVIIATDPDREGEAIGWHLQTLLSEDSKGKKNKDASQFVRSTFHEITKPAVLSAIEHPTTLNMDLVNAQQARRVLDRLVGYSVSPVLWKKIRSGLSAGRVQSVALRLIVEREREIEAFQAEEYWEVDVLLNTQKLGEKNSVKNDQNNEEKKIGKYFQEGKIEEVPKEMFLARVIEINSSKYDPKKEADVLPVTGDLENAHYVVQSVERKERNRASLPPFTTSTMQQQAATRLGFTSKRTMSLAQGLYEEGLITYHRTDSVNLSAQALEMARQYIGNTYGTQYIPSQPRVFSTKSKNAQEAHEAIRITDININSQEILGKLSDAHAKLYDLIWRRFVSSQMESAIYDQTTALVEAKGQQNYVLKSTGSTLKFDGWMKLFPNQGDVLLPELQPKQEVKFEELNAAQKFTQPPPRFNDASLIKTLESEGIGRPSTYASIISVIEDRGYVERKDKKFFPTPIGTAVIDFLVKYFNQIVDYKFTANMEDDLDAISRGEKEWQKIIELFYGPLEKTINTVVDTAERSQIPVEKTGEKCPKCGDTEGGEVVIRSGRYGKFKSCSCFPECDFTENIVNKIDGLLCPLCQQGEVVIKPTRYGRDFYSCTRYPECDWASWSKPAPGTTLTAEQWEQMKKEREERRKAREEKYGTQKGRWGAKKGAAEKSAPAKKTAKKKSTTKKKSATTKKTATA